MPINSQLTRVLMGMIAGLFLCVCAQAQTGVSGPSPLGMTSPLGIGAAAPVPRTGTPLGATELQSIGVSPLTSGTSPLAPAPSSSATCTGINSPAGNLSGGVNGVPSTAPGALFDGGGIAGTSSGTCANIG